MPNISHEWRIYLMMSIDHYWLSRIFSSFVSIATCINTLLNVIQCCCASLWIRPHKHWLCGTMVRMLTYYARGSGQIRRSRITTSSTSEIKWLNSKTWQIHDYFFSHIFHNIGVEWNSSRVINSSTLYYVCWENILA